MKRSIVALVLVILPVIAPLPVCAGRMLSRAPRPAAIGHVVLIKLNDPSQRETLIADCDSMLREIPSVRAYACGTHVEAGRSNVDSNYDVGLYVGFDDLAGYAAYIEHPGHVSLVSRWKPELAWMKVYDIGDPTP